MIAQKEVIHFKWTKEATLFLCVLLSLKLILG